MLTKESLRKNANESVDNDEWLCLVSGETFTIFKCNCQQDVEELVDSMVEINDVVEPCLYDSREHTYYTEVDHAKDWNYFKNTMVI